MLPFCLFSNHKNVLYPFLYFWKGFHAWLTISSISPFLALDFFLAYSQFFYLLFIHCITHNNFSYFMFKYYFFCYFLLFTKTSYFHHFLSAVDFLFVLFIGLLIKHIGGKLFPSQSIILLRFIGYDNGRGLNKTLVSMWLECFDKDFYSSIDFRFF
jgi:hypothetical protein